MPHAMKLIFIQLPRLDPDVASPGENNMAARPLRQPHRAPPRRRRRSAPGRRPGEPAGGGVLRSRPVQTARGDRADPAPLRSGRTAHPLAVRARAGGTNPRSARRSRRGTAAAPATGSTALSRLRDGVACGAPALRQLPRAHRDPGWAEEAEALLATHFH